MVVEKTLQPRDHIGRKAEAHLTPGQIKTSLKHLKNVFLRHVVQCGVTDPCKVRASKVISNHLDKLEFYVY